MERLSTFKLSKPPAEMTQQELEDAADRILDQWSEEIRNGPDSPQIDA